MVLRSIAGLAERNGRFFLAKRKPGGDLGNKWELPGGKLEEDESPQEAMVREWMEELELKVEVADLLGCGTFTHKGREFLLEMYSISFEDEAQVFHEHVETGWFTPNELDSLDLAGSDRIVLSAYLKEVKAP